MNITGFRSKDHIAFTFNLYFAKWFFSLGGTFIIWTFAIRGGHFVKHKRFTAELKDKPVSMEVKDEPEK